MAGWAETTLYLALRKGDLLPPEERAEESRGCLTGERLLNVRYIELAMLGPPLSLLPEARLPADFPVPKLYCVELGEFLPRRFFCGSSAS